MAGVSESEKIGGKMFSRKARCIFLVVCIVIIICSVPIYLKVVKDALGQYHVPRIHIPTFRIGGVKNELAVLEVKNISNVTARTNKVVLVPVPVHTTHNQQPPVQDEALVVGHPRERKGFLTIGILHNSPLPKGKSKLKRTLQSLIDNIPPSERLNISIVTVTSVLDATARQDARDIVSSFGEHVQSGLLQLIEVPRSFYLPNLQKLEGKLMEQVKRNFDAAFLFTYAKDKSEYYLQLSDSMKSTPHFVSNIRSYITYQKGSYWVALEFVPSGLALAGKLVRADARDIRQLIHLFSEYSKDQTTENLFKHFKDLNVQKGEFVRKPPLFVYW